MFGLPSWATKGLLVLIAIGFGAWLLRQHDNRVRNEAQSEERQKVTLQLNKQHEQQMLVLRAEIKLEREQQAREAEKIRKEVTDGFQKQDQKFAASSKKLQDNLTKIDTDWRIQNENLSNVSDTDLDQYLRALSRNAGPSPSK